MMKCILWKSNNKRIKTKLQLKAMKRAIKKGGQKLWQEVTKSEAAAGQ